MGAQVSAPTNGINKSSILATIPTSAIPTQTSVPVAPERANTEDCNQYEAISELSGSLVPPPSSSMTETIREYGAAIMTETSNIMGKLVNWWQGSIGEQLIPTASAKTVPTSQVTQPPAIRPPEDKKTIVKWDNANYQTLKIVPGNQFFKTKTVKRDNYKQPLNEQKKNHSQ